ncbi:hypothetical protein AB1N83_011489 [Pleurotus pulmonarius]
MCDHQCTGLRDAYHFTTTIFFFVATAVYTTPSSWAAASPQFTFPFLSNPLDAAFRQGLQAPFLQPWPIVVGSRKHLLRL